MVKIGYELDEADEQYYDENIRQHIEEDEEEEENTSSDEGAIQDEE